MSGLVCKAQGTFFSTFLHECQDQFSLQVWEGMACTFSAFLWEQAAMKGIWRKSCIPNYLIGKVQAIKCFYSKYLSWWGACHTTNIQHVFISIHARWNFLTHRKMFSCDIFLGISLKDRCRTFLWVLSSHSSQVDLCLHLKWMIMRKFLMNFKESLTALFFIIALALFPIFCCLPYCQSFCSFCPICRYRGALVFLSWD